MPSIKLDDLTPRRQEIFIVACIKTVGGTTATQVFGPYATIAAAERDCAEWNGVDGWTAEVDTVYPPDTKRSLLQPNKIGRY